MKNIKTISATVNSHPKRIILLAGAKQNVGKTTFACEIINHIKSLKKKVYAIKISPHFHDKTPPRTIFSDHRFILSLEQETTTLKDSSRMKAAGADEVFFLQVKDLHLKEAFNYTLSMIPPDDFIVIESGGLRNILKPALFFFLESVNKGTIKENAQANRLLADKIVEFDGDDFNFQIKNIKIVEGKIELNT